MLLFTVRETHCGSRTHVYESEKLLGNILSLASGADANLLMHLSEVRGNVVEYERYDGLVEQVRRTVLDVVGKRNIAYTLADMKMYYAACSVISGCDPFKTKLTRRHSNARTRRKWTRISADFTTPMTMSSLLYALENLLEFAE